MASQQEAPAGSQWRRWDPHLHAPGTLLNDQFKGDWDGYLTAIERATPVVEVLGVTDYFSIGCYRTVRRRWQEGRLPGVKLLFPNVEMRLDVASAKNQPINLHLLFCPDDDGHENEIERALTDLTFEYNHKPYRCTPVDLAALGRACNPTQRNEEAARCEGANQFKVTLDQLRKLFRNDSWMVRNCIVAVSGSSNDGTAGLKDDSSFAAWRAGVERLAHVIFASTPSAREFWLGKKPGHDVTVLEREHGGRKPCLHGCDAHGVDKVAAPDDERYCWIKGDPQQTKAPVPDYAAMDPLVFHIAFMTTDVRGMLQRLFAAGASSAGEVTITPTGDEMVFLRDPWGLALQLVKRTAPLLGPA